MQKWPRPSSYLGKWDPKRHTHSERQMDKQTHTQPNSKINLILLSALKWLHLYSGRKNKHREVILEELNINSYLNFNCVPSSLLATGCTWNWEETRNWGETFLLLPPRAHPHLTFCSNSLVSMVLNKSTEWQKRTEASPLSKQTLSRGCPGRLSIICLENQALQS